MAYVFDTYDNSIVISGFSNGIAPDPYSGIANLQSVNVDSVPNEASVMFATQSQAPTVTSTVSVTAAVSGTSVGYLTLSSTPAGLTGGNAISFSSVSVGGLANGTTVYWVTNIAGHGANTIQLTSDFEQTTFPDITSSGTASFFVYTPNFSDTGSDHQGKLHTPITAPAKRFAVSSRTGQYVMADSWGQVWLKKTEGWRFSGNTGHLGSDESNGNGIVYFQSSASLGYFFIFSDKSVDYFSDSGALTWVYGWQPSTGTTGSSTLSLNAGAASAASHDALVGQDNAIYICDSNFIDSVVMKSNLTFSPTDTTTYTWSTSALTLPIIDQALCVAELGINLLVGGQRNLVYPWDRTSTSFSYPIWLSESVVQHMVAIKQNTYVFVGNRGRIHITNGSQADVFKKIPDHISGTVSPYFTWGGADFTKNELLFSVNATDNAGNALSGYGGVWALNLSSGALKNLNTFSYGSDAGFSPTLIAQNPIPFAGVSTNPAGYGFYAGWNSGSATYGIDGTVSTPYTTSVSVIETDLIPIGTFNIPRSGAQVEYKLSKPLVSGESIKVYTRYDFADSYSSTAIISDSGPTTGFSNGVAFDAPANAQWVQFKIVLNSTATNPSYVRLTQLRITQVSGTPYPFSGMTAQA